VDGAAGRHSATAAGRVIESYLSAASAASSDAAVTATVSPLNAGGSVFASLVGRRVGTADYRGRAVVASTGAVSLQLQSSGTTLVSRTVTGLTYASGDRLRIRLQVTGTSPTTLRAKVWKIGTAEPETWTVTTTDSTAALQSAGHVGLGTYVGSGVSTLPQTVAFDDFEVRTLP